MHHDPIDTERPRAGRRLGAFAVVVLLVTLAAVPAWAGGGKGCPRKAGCVATSPTTAATATPTTTATTASTTVAPTTTAPPPVATTTTTAPTTTTTAPMTTTTTAPAQPGSSAPATQGTWVSPEGVTIEVATTGPWTIAAIDRLLRENALDLGRIGPSLRIRVQDSLASQTAVSAVKAGDAYSSFSAVLYLKGDSSTFASQPDAQFAHEYGHVWTSFHLYMDQRGNWSSYLDTRWSSADGALRLGQDDRLGTSYTWDRGEIIGDDYRLLFGSPAAVAQRPAHMNRSLVDPRNQPGLRDWFLESWGA